MSDLTIADATPSVAPPVARPRRYRTARTVLALILREMQTTYGRNVGGYAWALIEPIAGIVFFTVIISYGLRVANPSLGNSFALFYATGFMPLAMFNSVSNKVSTALRFSRPLLGYPGVEYTDALIARFILTAMTQGMVAFFLFLGIHLLFGVETILDAPAAIGGMALAALFGLGVGTLNCFLFSIAPLWESAFDILTRPLFVISTIFFTFEDVSRDFRDYLWWNPIVHTIGMVRRGFYATYDATWISAVYVAALSLILLALGLVFLQRYHDDILNR